jgi:hypothetical protein
VVAAPLQAAVDVVIEVAFEVAALPVARTEKEYEVPQVSPETVAIGSAAFATTEPLRSTS